MPAGITEIRLAAISASFLRCLQAYGIGGRIEGRQNGLIRQDHQDNSRVYPGIFVARAVEHIECLPRLLPDDRRMESRREPVKVGSCQLPEALGLVPRQPIKDNLRNCCCDADHQ
ncbi:MAG: hypothetical protein ACK5TM_07350 [Methylobacterium sp.]